MNNVKIAGCGCLTVLIWCTIAVAIGYLVDETPICKGVAKLFGVYHVGDSGTEGLGVSVKTAPQSVIYQEATADPDAILRDFALKESPGLWKAIETLEGDVSSQEKRIAELRQELENATINPEADADFEKLTEGLEEMKQKVATVREELKQAYIASVKYEAYWGKAEKAAFSEKLQQDGVVELEQIRARYESMNRMKREGGNR